MEAQVWTLIGLLGTVGIGSIFYLGSRIDGLNGRMDALQRDLLAEIRAQGRELGERIFEISAKLDDHLRRHPG
jgi:hypothetical protein